MSQTVTLPYTWINYMEQNYDYGFDNWYARLGWYYSSSQSQNRKYTMAFKIDTSQLAGVRATRIWNPRLFLYMSASYATSPFSITTRRLLKQATDNMTWTKYNGVNSWTSPGGESAGNDYSTDVISNSTIGGATLGWKEYPISVDSLLTIASNNSPIIIFPPTSSPSPGNNYYVQIVRPSFGANLEFAPYIEFELLSGQQQVIIF